MTCEKHGLDYVVDKTNFQPDLTRRNAVRHALSKIGSQSVQNLAHSSSSPPLGILDAVRNTVLTHTPGDNCSVLNALYYSVGSIQAEDERFQAKCESS